MELKLNVPIPEQECYVMDRMTGVFFKATEAKLLRAQEEVNDLVLHKDPITINECYEIITRDWPEDKKAEFFDRINSRIGWALDDTKVETLDLCVTNFQDGDKVIKLKFDLL